MFEYYILLRDVLYAVFKLLICISILFLKLHSCKVTLALSSNFLASILKNYLRIVFGCKLKVIFGNSNLKIVDYYQFITEDYNLYHTPPPKQPSHTHTNTLSLTHSEVICRNAGLENQ